MDERLSVIEEKVATGATMRKAVAKPMPVFLLYHTAFAAADGSLQVRPDFYGRDATVWRRLQRHQPEQEPARSGRMAAVTTRASRGR
jgi:murein L,D-transpeptidase YcbB/YkuD